MMQPKFDDIIDYVRAGEDDPDLKKLLDLHPDGKELLKQARYICRMLDLEIGKGRDKRGPAVAALRAKYAPTGRYDSIAASEDLAELSISETFAAEQRLPSKPRMARFARPPEELGTLELAFEEERICLSYEPAERADELRSFLADLEPPKPALAGIRIRGRSIQLSLPESIPIGEPLTVHLSHGARQMPARRQEMIFMPDSGAFQRLQADEEGRIDMLVPEQSGVLRVDTRLTELIRVRLKK